MHNQAFHGQCTEAESRHHPDDGGGQAGHRRPATGLTLFALALGTFAIGSGEFGSNGIIQLFAAGFRTSVPTATYAITAYAAGVMIGSPIITIAAAKVNRRSLLLGLMVLFVAGNVLSSLAANLALLIAFRFITGTVQGAYFGAGAVVAGYVYGPGKGGKAFATVMGGLTVATIFGSPLGTFIGQHAGWQMMYVAVAAAGALTFAALFAWVPRTDRLAGSSVTQELSSLKRRPVWVMAAVAALGISSIFAVYTFIGPFVTDAANQPAGLIPIALGVFGLGMATGNAIGGRVADRSESAGLIAGFGGTLVLLVVIASAGQAIGVLLPCLFGVGALMMLAIPTVQVRLTGFAYDAPTLMGALNLAALNLANSLGAIGGSVAISAGWGTLSTVWAGFVLTAAGLVLYVVAVPRSRAILRLARA
jgi:MFS transporter, DHA1 family, inner membrane transport protein